MHCGEVASIADVARRSDLAASAADLDAFVDEQRRRAVLVGLDSGIVPASMAELDIYFKQMRPGLRACDEAKESLRLLFHPPVPDGNRALKLGLPPFNALAFATLPGWVRRMYGRQGGPLTDIAATAGLRAARLALGRQRLFLGAAARAQPSAPRGLIHRRFRYEARRLGLRVVAPFRAKTTISITAR